MKISFTVDNDTVRLKFEFDEHLNELIRTFGGQWDPMSGRWLMASDDWEILLDYLGSRYTLYDEIADRTYSPESTNRTYSQKLTEEIDALLHGGDQALRMVFFLDVYSKTSLDDLSISEKLEFMHYLKRNDGVSLVEKLLPGQAGKELSGVLKTQDKKFGDLFKIGDDKEGRA